MVKQYSYKVAQEDAGARLDKFVTDKLEELSRSFVQKLIFDGHISVDDQNTKSSYSVHPGDIVKVSIPDPKMKDKPQAEDIPLEIIFEDEAVLVVNKPAGMVVHPGAGVNSGTLVNAFLAHISSGNMPDNRDEDDESDEHEETLDLVSISPGRPGIVHRLDKGTSGVMIMVKTVKAYYHLANQFKEHSIRRKYMALVCGNPKQDRGIIVAPIGRSKKDRKKMAVTHINSREANTEFRVSKIYDGYSLLDIYPKTGRTHQIRVHLAHIGHPVVGDPTYNSQKRDLEAAKGQYVRVAIQKLTRQCLHAQVLGFIHPLSNEYMEFSSPIPEDMQSVIDALRKALDEVI